MVCRETQKVDLALSLAFVAAITMNCMLVASRLGELYDQYEAEVDALAEMEAAFEQLPPNLTRRHRSADAQGPF